MEVYVRLRAGVVGLLLVCHRHGGGQEKETGGGERSHPETGLTLGACLALYSQPPLLSLLSHITWKLIEIIEK